MGNDLRVLEDYSARFHVGKGDAGSQAASIR